MSPFIVIIAALVYLAAMFLIATIVDKQAAKGRNWTKNPYVYALSMAVYCTAWTFYGSVGRAATSGMDFLPTYLGPALMAPLWYIVLHKIILVCKSQRITSIADFVSARYGKNVTIGIFVTLLLVVGIIPYIALQLKAVASSFELLCEGSNSEWIAKDTFYHDAAFYTAIVLGLFTMLYGTRKLEPSEKHPGLVATIAFESVIKLITFLLVGGFVTFYLYNGFEDIFTQGMARPDIAKLFILPQSSSPSSAISWTILTLLSMTAVMLLPRQFHVGVVENTDVKHISKTVWIFSLYLLLINIFVLPIAVGGLLHFSGSTISPDTFVIRLPQTEGANWLAVAVFLGGMAAASSMIIVETLALCVMVSNNVAVPLLLKTSLVGESQSPDVTGRILAIRRLSILTLLLLAYLYCRYIAASQSLVNIGQISFVAVAQLAPAVLGGIFWKRGNRNGAMVGLVVGAILWAYTLPLAALSEAGFLPLSLAKDGLFGISLLKPYALLGLDGLDKIAHGAFWSVFFNVLCYIGISLNTMPSALEHTQANVFVNIYKYQSGNESLWRGEANMEDIKLLLARFLGKDRSANLLRAYAKRNGLNVEKMIAADPNLVNYSEKVLAGAVGSASARLLITSAVKEDPLNLEEVMEMLDETKQILNYTRELERKSRELEQATNELKAANERLQEMDLLKDDFITTVTHELRTPMTAIKSLSSILYENEKLSPAKRKEFLGIIITQSERLSRLVNQVLDLEKMESGMATWRFTEVELGQLVRESLKEVEQLCMEKGISLVRNFQKDLPPVQVDKDRIIQVVINLVSNAIKFCPAENGRINVRLSASENFVHLRVTDNGTGIAPDALPYIFDKFTQFNDYKTGRQGSGLGLSITQRIVTIHHGTITVESTQGEGASFEVALPFTKSESTNEIVSLSEQDLTGGVTMLREIE